MQLRKSDLTEAVYSKTLLGNQTLSDTWTALGIRIVVAKIAKESS